MYYYASCRGGYSSLVWFFRQFRCGFRIWKADDNKYSYSHEEQHVEIIVEQQIWRSISPADWRWGMHCWTSTSYQDM